ncbi:hypothetical protein SERLA73DRAFT_49361 [Serpula lacrymans var. lacrymans S7.3]|uniref:Protein argonaute N-terminal domain-containing protein n=1 Tax=Serpula lacrymans var. lacrymans (strain S7.3) TaxID=936435 RepID=F8PP05_SERL3|nr:hypothetical protein SERLA73DRAFT_49361 [Serpula lacrymans var. lacrymans S7.3]
MPPRAAAPPGGPPRGGRGRGGGPPGGGPPRGGPPRGGPPRGGGPPGRGGGPPPPAVRGPVVVATSTGALPDRHVQTVGVKRSDYGRAGRVIPIASNFFNITLPENIIYHYDVISPSEKTLPARLNMELIKHLQTIDAPNVFTPPAVYDGRKNMFASRRLALGATDSQEVYRCTRRCAIQLISSLV